MTRNRPDKPDANQNDIVKALRKIPGVTVELGHDDILVGYKGKTYWYEIKNPDTRSKKTGKILDSKKKKHQIELENGWEGHYKLITDLNEILEDIFGN